MNRLNFIMKYLLGLFILLCISGCSSWRNATKLGQPDIAFKALPASGFEIRSLKAYRLKEGLFIKGSVARTDYKNSSREKAHVDLAFRDKQGSLIGEVSVPYFPEVVQYMRHRASRFNLVIHEDMPSEVIVSVMHHFGDTHESSNTINASGPYPLFAGLPVL